MLLAQKSYVEGGLALELYCARLVDESRTGSAAAAVQAATLLEVLTPIAKSWPSEWCLEANSLAIQVHGGYGYTRDFPVEQLWRDNRLNMIHEGTHGIQGLDLLGRKVLLDGGAALALLAERVAGTVHRASARAELRTFSVALEEALRRLRDATSAAWATANPDEALANATPYLQAFGHVIVAWMWLDIALAATWARDERRTTERPDYLLGKLQATRYFFEYELPKIDAWLGVVASRNPTCRQMREEWFSE
jgi:butyryl-CoA dehydrogenase